MIETNHLLVLVTCPDRACAETIAYELVASNLVACVNIQPGIKSIFLWQGAVDSAEETLLFIKTTTCRFADAETAIRARHPYELPEIIAVPIVAGAKSYLDWIDACVQKR